MAENKKETISKKLRYEIFKRDNFTCQCCRVSAPDAILTVERIEPTADGDKNDVMNLITRCRDCATGKTDKKTSDMTIAEQRRKHAEEIQARSDMIQLICQWQQDKLYEEDMEIDIIESFFSATFQLTFKGKGRAAVRNLLHIYGFNEVREAAQIAVEKYNHPYIAIDKLGGICYNRKIGRGADYYK